MRPVCAPGDNVEIATFTLTGQTVVQAATVALSHGYPDMTLTLTGPIDPGPRLRTRMPCCTFPAETELEKISSLGVTSNCGAPAAIWRVTGMITPSETPFRSVN